MRTWITFTITVMQNATNKGTIPIFNARLSLWSLISLEDVRISFWINMINRNRMPINAIEPARATVVMVETVDVVTVEIMNVLPYSCLPNSAKLSMVDKMSVA